MKLTKLVVASFNRHKVEEISEWFAPYGLEFHALSDFCSEMPPETGATFAENARLKAMYGLEVTGLPTLADDSGLEVDALGGRPGVYSARYAGDGATDAENNRKLLVELADTNNRTARFHCAMALATGENIFEAAGFCLGQILQSPRGSGGFGYDPLFWLTDRNLTMAELSQEEKNEISHRGSALANLVKELSKRGAI